MLTTTLKAISSILETDPSIDPAARARMMTALKDQGKADHGAGNAAAPTRLLRRGEVAKRMSVTTRAVDEWARTGILKRVHLPGRVRGAGFREADVQALIDNPTAVQSGQN
jgi:hypothetical protein